MPKYFHFGSVSGKLWLFGGTFLDNFWPKIGPTSNFFSRKQKNWHLQNFNHEFLTYQSVFLQNWKKKSKMTLIFFGFEHCRKKMNWCHPVHFLSQNFFDHIFFKFPFPTCSKTCNLVQWVESYDHLKIFRRLFLVQNTIFFKNL
jgi:hypothetical protein